jgi:hypothetical protein
MDCKSCRWFEATPDYFGDDDMTDELCSDKTEYGFCHRHAPAPSEFDPSRNLEVRWPLVWESEFCGAWMPSKEGTHGR